MMTSITVFHDLNSLDLVSFYSFFPFCFLDLDVGLGWLAGWMAGWRAGGANVVTWGIERMGRSDA
jgi:hypothetical protein